VYNFIIILILINDTANQLFDEYHSVIVFGENLTHHLEHVTTYLNPLFDKFDSLPSDVQSYVLKFLPLDDIVNSRNVCRAWKSLVDENSFWKTLLLKHFTETEYSNFDLKGIKDWKETYQKVWTNLHCLKFLPDYSPNIQICDNGATIEHIEGLRYAAIRTKSGFKKGVHYWECYPLKCTIDGYNSYVGVGTENIAVEDFLGSDSYGWGYKGADGLLYHCGDVLKTSNEKKKKCGLALRMDMQWEFYLIWTTKQFNFIRMEILHTQLH